MKTSTTKNKPAIADSIVVANEETPATFRGLSREEFIAVQLLNAGAKLEIVEEVVTTTPDKETLVNSFLAPVIKTAVKLKGDDSRTSEVAPIVNGFFTDETSRNEIGKTDFRHAADILTELRVPLDKVTLADLV